LARILTTRKLNYTQLGIHTLTAAAWNDAIVRCLLVISIAYIKDPTGSFRVLYIALVMIAYTLFMYYCVRPLLVWLVDNSSKDQVASSNNTFALFSVLFASSFFTQTLGLSTLFGAFLVGLITPHQHGFAISITEKVEDLYYKNFLI
jgi:Kef-type K+ transport system membrane component KefB